MTWISRIKKIKSVPSAKSVSKKDLWVENSTQYLIFEKERQNQRCNVTEQDDSGELH